MINWFAVKLQWKWFSVTICFHCSSARMRIKSMKCVWSPDRRITLLYCKSNILALTLTEHSVKIVLLQHSFRTSLFVSCTIKFFLTLSVTIPDEGRNLTKNFYWRLKRFYEGLKDLYKTFWDTTECENENLS